MSDDILNKIDKTRRGFLNKILTTAFVSPILMSFPMKPAVAQEMTIEITNSIDLNSGGLTELKEKKVSIHDLIGSQNNGIKNIEIIWKEFKGQKAKDISISDTGVVSIVGLTGKMAYLNKKYFKATRGNARNISSGNGHTAFHLANNGTAYQGNMISSIWTGLDTKVDHIAARTHDIYVASSNNLYIRINNKWVLKNKRLKGKIRSLAADIDGRVWYVGRAGTLYKSSDYGVNFKKVNGDASSVALGPDGSVWHLAGPGYSKASGGYSIFRSIDDGKSWQQVPGRLIQLAIDNSGLPWGVNSVGKIYSSSFKK